MEFSQVMSRKRKLSSRRYTKKSTMAGAAGLGAAGLGAAGLGAAGIGTAGLGMAGLGTAGLGTAGLGTAGHGAAGLGTAGHGAAGHSAAGLGAAGLGAAGLGAAGLGAAGLGAAGLGAAGLGAAGLGAAGLGAAGPEPARPGEHLPAGWYASSGAQHKFKRYSRHMERQSFLWYYIPVTESESSNKGWSKLATLKPYTNDVLLFNKLWTPEHWRKNFHYTESFFNEMFHTNRFENACFMGVLMVQHFILHLRPEDGEVRMVKALQTLPINIAGKVCHSGGDLLFIHRRRINSSGNKPTDLNLALLCLKRVMEAIRGCKGPILIPTVTFQTTGLPVLTDDGKPVPRLLELSSLSSPSSLSRVRGIDFKKGDPRITALSKFFKVLFSPRYIYLHNNKTRYAVEVLQLAFVAFQQLADTAMWSLEYGYALYLVQNMTLITSYFRIFLPLPELERYYTFTMTDWYYGRIHFHLALLYHNIDWERARYADISKAYTQWREKFYSYLQREICKERERNRYLVDPQKFFVQPESREKLLLKSYNGYKDVQIPLKWTRSKRQQDFAILYNCRNVLGNWRGSLSEKYFSFQTSKKNLHSVLEELDCIETKLLPNMDLVVLSLLKAKCLSYLSILDVSQLINWTPKTKIQKDLFEYSFEYILNLPEHKISHSEGGEEPDEAEKDAEQVGADAENEQKAPDLANEGPTSMTRLEKRQKLYEEYMNSPEYAGNIESWSEDVSNRLTAQAKSRYKIATPSVTGLSLQPAASIVESNPSTSGPSKIAIVSRKPFERLTGEIYYQIYNIPVAIGNTLEANKKRLEALKRMYTEIENWSDFSEQLVTATSLNIMMHYIHLQEYETCPDILWQMTRDFASVLNMWFPAKTKKRKRRSLVKAASKMLNIIFTFIFLGGCLAFYLMYRLGGNRKLYNNARYFYAMTFYHIIRNNLWDTVLIAMAEHARMRYRLLLPKGNKGLMRVQDRCVAIIRSYLYMLPLLYEYCIYKETRGGPTKCEGLKVSNVAFPFNRDEVDYAEKEDAEILKILLKAKDYLRKELHTGEHGTKMDALPQSRCYTRRPTHQFLEYENIHAIKVSKSVPKYPALDRITWKAGGNDTRPMCTGDDDDDDCESGPCTVEEYINEEELLFSPVCITNEPNFLKDLLDLNKGDPTVNFSLFRALLNMKEILKELIGTLESCVRQCKDKEVLDKFMRFCIPGISADEQSRAVPNGRKEDVLLRHYTKKLARSKKFLTSKLPVELALCKSLLCLDKLFNLQFGISDIFRGSIKNLDGLLNG